MIRPARPSPTTTWTRCLLLACVTATGWVGPASAEPDPAALKGLGYLRSHAGHTQVGEAGLMALAMIKAEVPENDPALSACLGQIASRFSGSLYTPERQGGADIYEASVLCLALVNQDPKANQSRIQALASYLIGRQNPNGSWDYNGRSAGDTSISQYGVLGLWEAENAGVRIAPEVWDRAAAWFLSVQSPAGSWNYHRDEGPRWPETLSMTAAGVGSLLICKRQLAAHNQKAPEETSSLLTPLDDDPSRRDLRPYRSRSGTAAINAAVNRGIAWLGGHFAPGNDAIAGSSAYYGLYGMERVGGLVDRETLGGLEWFEQGRSFLVSTQHPDGSWSDDYGSEVNTSYAILFLTKATAQSIRKLEIKRLGAGTLLGGRGLPEDLSSLTVAQGRVVVRPMNGAVEGMLAVLEDPRSEEAESALAGLIVRYRAEGPSALRPHRDRFLKLILDPDPGVRRVAAWALGRLNDLDAVPDLIDALVRPGEVDPVVTEVRNSLQFLGRKIEGYGPPDTSTPEDRQASARAWRSWYRATRPIGEDPAADLGAAAPGASR